jgi:hypothetical protein
VAAAPSRQQAPAASTAASAGSQVAASGNQQAPAARSASSTGSQGTAPTGSQVAAPTGNQQAPAGRSASSTGSQGGAASSGSQGAAASSNRRAPSISSALAASPEVAAAPSEMQARAASASAHGRSSGSVAERTKTAGRPTAAGPSAQPATQPAAAQPAAAQPVATPQPAAAPQPYWIYDSVTPSSIPSSSQAVAVYANGNYAAQTSQVGQRGLVLWIDTNGSDPHADVLDVEPGDATPPQAATWVAAKLDASPNSVAIVYTMRSDWGAVQSAINALPWWMPSHTRYWIADPTGVPHIVPGSQATQWYWGQNYDISTALPNF